MTNKKLLTLLSSAALLPALNVMAGFAPQSPGDKFGAHELTLDLFSSYTVPEHRDFGNGRLGIGVGANYFFNYYIGAGLDTGVDSVDFPNHINSSIIFRYPIEKWSLAPYVFTGFGGQFHDPVQWTYHIAGGFDFRLNPKLGVFTDIGATIPEESRDFMLWRVGVRFRL